MPSPAGICADQANGQFAGWFIRRTVWDAEAMSVDDFQCLACGGPVEPALARLASTRCHDCRDDDLPFDPALLAHALGTGTSAPPD